MKTEIYKDIPSYEGLYQVSNLGNVKSLNYKRTKTEKVLQPRIDGSGYACVALCKNKTVKNIGTHKLVAMAFLNHKTGNRNMVVDHINFIKYDNRLDNLQVISFSHNINRKYSDRISYEEPISSILNGLKNNEKTEFPTSRYSVISSTIQRIQTDNGSKFQIKKRNTTIEVTRVN